MLNPHGQTEAEPFYTKKARLRRLEVALQESPHSIQSWHWRAQIKVLSFILSRYGDQTDVPTLPPKNQPLLHFEVPKWPNPPKPRGKLRKILKRIKKTNELKPNEPLPRNTLPDGSPAPLFITSRASSKTPPPVPRTPLGKITQAEISPPVFVIVMVLWLVFLLIYNANSG